MEIGQGAYSIEVAPAQIKVMSIGIWGAVILTTVRFIQGHGIGGE
jgi:hypothetical protein